MFDNFYKAIVHHLERLRHVNIQDETNDDKHHHNIIKDLLQHHKFHKKDRWHLDLHLLHDVVVVMVVVVVALIGVELIVVVVKVAYHHLDVNPLQAFPDLPITLHHHLSLFPLKSIIFLMEIVLNLELKSNEIKKITIQSNEKKLFFCGCVKKKKEFVFLKEKDFKRCLQSFENRKKPHIDI
jgi:hypothetical protein